MKNNMFNVVMAILLFLATLLISAPESHASSGWETHSELFAEVSQKTGIDVRELTAVASLESSFRPHVKASTSSATGLFQFTTRTWRVTLKTYGEKYLLDPSASRKDPYANALMGAEYMKENRRVLKKKLGREPNIVDVYMAHLIAPRRVAALDDINPNAKLAYIYPRIASANKSLFYDDNDYPLSVSQFKTLIKDKVYDAYFQYEDHALAAVDHYYQNILTDAAYSDCLVPAWSVMDVEPAVVETMKVVLTTTPVLTAPNKRIPPKDNDTQRVVVGDRRWTV